MTAQGRGAEDKTLADIADDDDPRIRQVYRRLRVLTLIGALTMGVGFLSVMSVIAYRLVKGGGMGTRTAERELVLPSDARVLSVAAEDGRIVVTVEAAGRTAVHVFDAGSLAPTGRLDILPGGHAAPPGR